MPEIFISSDHHFFHENIRKYCPNSRNFTSVNEMNEAIIERHNSLVKPEDEVYFLGDFAFTNDEQAVIDILQRMSGKKYFLFGNHDRIMRSQKVAKCFEWMKNYTEIKVDGKDIILFHYPILEWNKCHRGSYAFHGHLHSSRIYGRSKDIGLDSNNCYPYNVRTLIEQLKDNKVDFYHKERGKFYYV